MESFLIYIAKSGICLSIFMLTYAIFLRPTTFYKFNRVFLVSGFILSLIIPSVRYTYDVIVPAITVTEQTFANTEHVIESTAINIWNIISVIYSIGFTIFILRNIIVYGKLRSYIRNGIETRINNIKIVENKDIKSPFSVLNYILFNPENLSETEKKLILKHESMHISQKHWLDLLCSEFILLIQWFNPLAWIYVQLLKENHEFLADKAVIDSGVSPTVYQAVLINQRFQGEVFSISSSFNNSKPVNRLNMLKKIKSSPWKRISVLLVVPVFGFFIWLSAVPNYIIQPKTESKADITIPLNSTESEKPQVIVLGAKDSAKIEFKEKSITTNAKELQPLYIVDGVKSENDITSLKPENIESISVLKDQSATELYGEEGKGGVIIITTKKDNLGLESSASISKLGMPENKTISKPENDALIYIDGKEASAREMDALDPNDIKSMEVTKNTSTETTSDKKSIIRITTNKNDK